MLKMVFGLSLIFVFAAYGKTKQVSVMSYNLENLFDTQHDRGKKDWTYLPLKFKRSSKEAMAYCHGLSNEWYKKNCLELDWSASVFNKKINNLVRVIKEYRGGADILVFQEVENLNALRELQQRLPAYRSLVLVEGPDSRGIDVAIMAKYKLTSKTYHKVSMAPYSSRSTRGILEANFAIGGKTVAVFANHWPSQANPDETRVNASEVLVHASLHSHADMIIAAGDFNTVQNDQINALERNIRPLFVDVEDKGRNNKHAPGTHWYRGHWESLDKIYIWKRSLSKGSKVDYSSFEIVYHSYMLQDVKWQDSETGEERFDRDVPKRFDPKTGNGYSDHLPVAITLRL